MFGHKPKMYRSAEGCCICRAKSSSSRFTDGQRYERDFKSCFGLGEARCGEICNACVLLVKRWKKLPAGSQKNWNHVVDAKGGSSLKAAVKTRRMKKARPSQISRVQKELKRNDSDAHSTTSSTSPAQSPSYSNQSDEGSDTELSPGHAPVFSFLDLTYWKRKKVCCGIIYKGRYGEVLIHPHLYKPCCQKKPQPEEEDDEEEEEGEEEVVEEEEGEEVVEEEPVQLEKETNHRCRPAGSPVEGVRVSGGEEW